MPNMAARFVDGVVEVSVTEVSVAAPVFLAIRLHHLQYVYAART